MSETTKSPIRSVNPATGVVEKVFDVMSSAQIDQIIANADEAFKSWRKVKFSERAAIINKVAAIMRARKEELGKLATREMGKLLTESLAEVELSAQIFEYYAENAELFLADEHLPAASGKAFTSFEPIGTILSIQPWNFPYYQITRSAAPNLMAGNTMVLKHASNVPQCAKMMEQIFLEAGLPKGVYTNLFIPGASMDPLMNDPCIKAVSFTGSEPAGVSVAAAASKQVKKSTLELGGSDPFIVLDDADIDKTAVAAVNGRFWNAGQVCISPKRMIVLESVAPKFIEKVTELVKKAKIGDPMNPETQLAPLSSEGALLTVLEQVKKTVAQGAKLLYGGKRLDRPGAFMEPVILTGIKKGMLAYSEEIFGPVFCIYVVKSEQEAIDLANDSDYGLGGSVFSTNKERAVKVARQVVTGMVYINQVTGIEPALPFGGTKHSGYGREQGKEGILEFVNHKLIRVVE